MKYNKALDILAMAVAEMNKRKPNHTLAARLFAKAAAEPDAAAAIDIIESSNRVAKAKEDAITAAAKEGTKTVAAFPAVDDESNDADEFPKEDDGEVVADFEGDPVLEFEDEEPEEEVVPEVVPAKTMAGVLSKLAAKANTKAK